MRERGQLVLLAAAALAVALLPLVTALGQLGYHPDVRPATPGGDTAESIRWSLHRAVADLAASLPGTYAWSERDRARAAVADELDPLRRHLNRSRLTSGAVVGVTRNHSRARRLAARSCPGGPDRQFGACEADDGVVLQARSGRTHLVAVAVDVRVVREGRATTAAFTLRPTPPA